MTISGGALAGGVTPPSKRLQCLCEAPLTKLKNHSARFRAVDGTGGMGAMPLITWFNFIDIFPDRARRFCDCRRHLSFKGKMTQTILIPLFCNLRFCNFVLFVLNDV